MILMMVSGLYITWGFSPITRKQFWYERSSENEHIIVIISWFIGSSIGAVVLLFIHERFTKKTLYVSVLTYNPTTTNLTPCLIFIFPDSGGADLRVQHFTNCHFLARISGPVVRPIDWRNCPRSRLHYGNHACGRQQYQQYAATNRGHDADGHTRGCNGRQCLIERGIHL